MLYLQEAKAMNSGEVYITHTSSNNRIAPKLVDIIKKKLGLSDVDDIDDDWGGNSTAGCPRIYYE
jgi:hypothetical protein